MDHPGECPDRPTLVAYHVGHLNDGQLRALDSHIAGCEACSELLQEISAAHERGSGETSDPIVVSSGSLMTETLDGDSNDFFDDEASLVESLLLGETANESAIGRIGKHDVLGVLGHGGMGVVLRGHDSELRREVAIKTLNRMLSASSVAKRRFKREARAAAAINHPHVVTIYSVDQHRGIPFLVMELLAGRTLRDQIKREGPLDPIRVLRISSQIASGLAAAHLQGVIHRDIKPGNVMLEFDVDRCKITDFGLARAAVDNVELTSRELAVGTPAYMSPEQVGGEEVDARSDLFSLGCVMFAMLVGHSPFHGRNALEMIRKVEDCAPTGLASIDETIPAFLCEIVDRLLQKDPENRIQSAAELSDVLNRHLTRINQTGSDEHGQIPLSPPPVKRRMHLVRWGGIGLTICALLGGASWAIWGTAPQPPVVTAQATGLLRVAQDGSADFQQIGAAVEAAAPGAVIEITDDATYAEAVVLATDEITLKASQGATLRSPKNSGGPAPVLEIRDCRKVTVEGLSIISDGSGNAVYLHGDVASIALRDLKVGQDPNRGDQYTVRMSARSSQADGPAVLVEDCQIGTAKFPCIWFTEHTASTKVTDSTLLAMETAIGIWGASGNLEISGCVFQGGISGINAVVRDWSGVQQIRWTNNTFDSTTYWLGIHTTIPATVEIKVANNLILGCRSMELTQTLLEDLDGRHTFVANFWQTPPELTWTPDRMSRVAEEVQGSVVLSRDPLSSEYLRLPPGSPLAEQGAGGDLPSYVGALPP